MSTDAAMNVDHGKAGGHGAGPAFLQHHFDTPIQQFDSAKLGMWLFLAQEILFFSGLFVFYAVYRYWFPEAFSAGSHLLDKDLGLLNTAVLLTSSFTMALAVRSSQKTHEGSVGAPERRKVTLFLLLTIGCALVFMVVKYLEYSAKFHHGLLPGRHFAPTELHGMESVPYAVGNFFGVYFMMTGVHGLHVLVGIGVLLWILKRNVRGDFSARYYTPVEVTGLYWHLVDLIWIYLYPLLYLID